MARKKTRDFGTFKKWKDFGLKRKYDKKTRGEIKIKDQSFYITGYNKKWLDKFEFVEPARKKTIYPDFNAWLAMVKKQGLPEMSKNDACEQAWPLMKAGYTHRDNTGKKWVDYIRFKETTHRRGADFEHWLQECKKLKLDTLTRKEFYVIAPNHIKRTASGRVPERLQTEGIRSRIDYLIPGQIRTNWKKDGFDAWLAVGKKNQYEKMTRKELELRDPTYYGIGIKYALAGTDTTWLDALIPKKYRNVREISDLLKTDPETKEVLLLAQYGGAVGDITEMLMKLWPERFPSAAALARALPGAVQHIGKAIEPFDFERAARFYTIVQKGNKQIEYVIEDVLYQILIDAYQLKFNDAPRATVQEIMKYTKHAKIRGLAARVANLYNNVYTFDIPGQGSLAQRD